MSALAIPFAQWQMNFGGNQMNIESVAAGNKRSTDHKPSTKSGGKLLLVITFALVSMQLAGCCNVPRPDLFDGSILDKAFGCYRDSVWAKRACNLRYSNCDRPYASHFEAGFEAGYVDICNGGDGYVPATPPECYWGFDYQTPDGAQCVNSWFEGYPAGVAAAKRDHAGTYRDIYVSRMIQSAISQDKATKTTPQDVPIVKPTDKVPIRSVSTVNSNLSNSNAPNPVNSNPVNSNPVNSNPVSAPNPFLNAPLQPNKSFVPPVVPANYDYGAKRN